MMHENETATGPDLVRRLLAAQFPHWAGLPIHPVPSTGTDNDIYRLGDDMAVRLPRIDWAVGQVAKERRWLPALAPHLPAAVPVPLAMGAPGEGYPWPWSVVSWLAGENPTAETLRHSAPAAAELAAFIRALQAVDATGGPRPGGDNSGRGAPLATRIDELNDAVAQLRQLAARGIVLCDIDAAVATWEEALGAPLWDWPPVWVHGDLQPGNVLVAGGRLRAVIDFGCLGVGDPAVDLLPAWNLFGGETRQAFREALGVDDATWARGKGWAVSVGLIALPYYYKTNPGLTEMGQGMIEAVVDA